MTRHLNRHSPFPYGRRSARDDATFRERELLLHGGRNRQRCACPPEGGLEPDPDPEPDPTNPFPVWDTAITLTSRFVAGLGPNGEIGIGDGFGTWTEPELAPHFALYTPVEGDTNIWEVGFDTDTHAPITFPCSGGGRCRGPALSARIGDAMAWRGTIANGEFFPWMGVHPTENRLEFSPEWITKARLMFTVGTVYRVRLRWRDPAGGPTPFPPCNCD